MRIVNYGLLYCVELISVNGSFFLGFLLIVN